MKSLYQMNYILAIIILYLSVYIWLYSGHFDKNSFDIVEVIKRHTNVCETHRVRTEDGYILTTFRIPRKNRKGTVLLQHSLFWDAREWVSQFNDSIAFLFWRAGYDVWLGNTRGNFFCKKHATLSSTDRSFWNFSFHEMGFYDHHATINYIKRNTSGSQIIFLGYSLGATTGIVYASTRPEDASKSIKLLISIAPVTHYARGTSIAKYFGPTLFYFQRIFNVDIYYTIMRYDSWYLKLSRYLFSVFPCRRCVVYFTGLIAGGNPEEMDPSFVDQLLKLFGSETPLKLLGHFNQISAGKFQMYDFGEELNLRIYGDREPHLYPVQKIEVPIFLIHGQNDSFTCPEDNEVLYSVLPDTSKIYGKLMVKNFNHADFLLGRTKYEKVYKKILFLLENI